MADSKTKRQPERITLQVTPHPPAEGPSSEKAQADKIEAFLFLPDSPEETLGGIILIQEIFGVNAHIRELASHWADLGFTVLAPAYFDHIQRGVELAYNDRDFVRGRDFVSALGWDTALADTWAAVEALQERLPERKKSIGIIGFCWGGSLAWLAATRFKVPSLKAAVSYYGRQVVEFKNETPNVPVIFHFGRRDPLIPMLNVKAIEKAHPELPVYLYDAGHGFNCNHRKDYDSEASALAEQRSLEFLKEALA